MERRKLTVTFTIILGLVIVGGGLLWFGIQRSKRRGCDPQLKIDLVKRQIKFDWYCKGFLPPEESEEYYGHSTHGSCQSDANCIRGGCNKEICQSGDEKPFVSICLAPDKPTPEQLGYQCRCVETQCRWAK